MKARRHMREYTPAEMRRIRACARKRLSARVTAKLVGRSPGALRYKAIMVSPKVRFRSIDRAA